MIAIAIRTESRPWTQALREGAVAGSVASVLSTIALAALGSHQNGSAVAPINTVSHWLWGDEALREDRPTLRHTLIGYLTQHAASVFWAALYARVYGHKREAKQLPNAIAGGIATAATAALIDYTVVPKRLTPGYENRLSPGGMVTTFAALAAGFAIGELLLGRVESRSLMRRW
jgi:hypothetical protein